MAICLSFQMSYLPLLGFFGEEGRAARVGAQDEMLPLGSNGELGDAPGSGLCWPRGCSNQRGSETPPSSFLSSTSPRAC